MLEIGDKAPDFSGMDAEGNTLRLSDFKGRKLVLYFYPKDNTSGCTAEACDLRDNYERFLAQGYSIVGVSKDSADSHRKFAQKHSLPFPLIADTDRKILQDYQAWGEKTLYGKKTEGTPAQDLRHRRERRDRGHHQKSGHQSPHRSDPQVIPMDVCKGAACELPR